MVGQVVSYLTGTPSENQGIFMRASALQIGSAGRAHQARNYCRFRDDLQAFHLWCPFEGLVEGIVEEGFWHTLRRLPSKCDVQQA
jgi:hypothetical protein